MFVLYMCGAFENSIRIPLRTNISIKDHLLRTRVQTPAIVGGGGGGARSWEFLKFLIATLLHIYMFVYVWRC